MSELNFFCLCGTLNNMKIRDERTRKAMLKKLLWKISMLGKNGPRNTVSRSLDTKESLSKDLQKNLRKITDIFGNSSDISIREFSIGMDSNTDAAVVFIDGLVEKSVINENILKPLMLYSRGTKPTPLADNADMLDVLKRNVLTVAKSKEVSTIEEITDAVLSGETALLIAGYSSGFRVFTKGWETRGVEEPKTESVVRGPREGFSETLRTNTALLRRKIKNPNLVLETLKVGRVTRTDVCIAYIRGIADEKVVRELKKRMNRIDIDGILESGYIEAFIEDAPLSIFPTIGNTEKPDTVAAKMLEDGKISNNQAIKLLFITISSTAVLFAPTIIHKYAKQDSWIPVVLITILAIVFSYIIATLGLMFKGKTIVQYKGE